MYLQSAYFQQAVVKSMALGQRQKKSKDQMSLIWSTSWKLPFTCSSAGSSQWEKNDHLLGQQKRKLWVLVAMVPPLSILGSKQYDVEMRELGGGEGQSLPSSGRCLLFLCFSAKSCGSPCSLEVVFFFFWKIFSRNYISVMITCSALALAVDLY